MSDTFLGRLAWMFEKSKSSRESKHAEIYLDQRRGKLIALVYRVLEICSPGKLANEVNKIKNILLQNGYPKKVLRFQFFKHLEERIRQHVPKFIRNQVKS